MPTTTSVRALTNIGHDIKLQSTIEITQILEKILHSNRPRRETVVESSPASPMLLQMNRNSMFNFLGNGNVNAVKAVNCGNTYTYMTPLDERYHVVNHQQQGTLVQRGQLVHQ